MITYSLHLSNKKHALTTTRKVAGASKHNLRRYQSDEYSRDNIIVLAGGDCILDDVKNIYHQEFDASLEEYNKGKRSDRQIKDYLQYVSENGKNDVAAEMIIQLGDKEFWSDKSLEQKKMMESIYREQLSSLETLIPNFKVASSVIHLDEASPHMHIIGVPVASGYQRGMKKQVAKTKVFTTTSLSMLQEEMHKRAEEAMSQHPELFDTTTLKGIERGRNADWSKEYYIEQKKEKLQDLTEEIQSIEQSKQQAVEEYVKTTTENAAQKEFMHYAQLENPKSPIGKTVSVAWKQFRAWWDKVKKPKVEEKARESILERLEEAKRRVEDKNSREQDKRRKMEVEKE